MLQVIYYLIIKIFIHKTPPHQPLISKNRVLIRLRNVDRAVFFPPRQIHSKLGKTIPKPSQKVDVQMLSLADGLAGLDFVCDKRCGMK